MNNARMDVSGGKDNVSGDFPIYDLFYVDDALLIDVLYSNI